MNIIVRLTCTVLSLIATLLITPIHLSAETKPIDLRIAMWVGATHPAGMCVKQWSDELEKRTQGRIKSVFYYSEALGKANTYADLLQTGGTDAAAIIFSYTPGRFPLLEVMNLPFSWPNGDVANKVFYDLFNKGYFTKELANYKLLYLRVTAPYDIIAKMSIRTPNDLKGKRLRSAGGPWTSTIKEWGAVPTTIPVAEVYPALERGILDGVVLGVAPIFNLKLQEVAKFVNLNHIGSASFVLAMNLDYYKKLPANIKAAIDDLAKKDRITPMQGKFFDKEVTKALAQLPGLGVNLFHPSPDELAQWQKSSIPVIDNWIQDMEKKGLPGKNLIEDLVNSAKKYGVTLGFKEGHRNR